MKLRIETNGCLKETFEVCTGNYLEKLKKKQKQINEGRITMLGSVARLTTEIKLR